MKIKFKDLGIRVVYKVERVSDVMRVIVISARTDEQVYQEAAKRKDQYGAFCTLVNDVTPTFEK